MAEKTVDKVRTSDIECCPELSRKRVCDTLKFRYRLPFHPQVGDKRQVVPVEVVLYFLLERCSGPLVLGDPVYSTTLLPGEQVRLFTRDRHTRWSYDSETSLSYRHETTSEESYFTAAMARSMSDLTINESGVSSSYYEESWAEGGGGASIDLFGIIEIGGGGGGGSYDAHSAAAFSRSLSRHTEAASSYVAAGVRAKSSTAIGEVERRTHAEGESEAHYESSSRIFSNPNRCKAVTYFFYKINKIQHIRFKIVAIERRVVDPLAPTGAFQRFPVDSTRVAVVPQSILATSKNRLQVEQMARTSVLERQQAEAGIFKGRIAFNRSSARLSDIPINRDLRNAALAAVDKDLVAANMLDTKTGAPSEKIVAELSWERDEILPTPGLLVKGCLDKCNTCEPALQREIELDLERKKLENGMLKRQIELLDKAQEYRCCPAGEEEGSSDE
jgi:hypothetical protein